MKISLIVFLAKYYYKIPTESVTNLKYILAPLFAILVPVLLVAQQPDLGTAVLILARWACSYLVNGFEN